MHPSETARRLFTGIASNYDRPAEVLSLFQYSRWHRYLLSKLHLPDEARVLDIATGTGAVALRAAQRPGVGAVILTSLLRYVVDVPSTLSELARVLKPGGVMVSLEFALPGPLVYPLWRLYTTL